MGLFKFVKFSALLFLISCSFFSEGSNSKTLENKKLNADLILKLNNAPWAMEFLDKGSLLITLKKGDLVNLNLKTKKTFKINGSPESSEHGQGGLLDIMLHPDFNKNNILYFTYTKKVKDNYTTALAQGVLKNNSIVNLKDLFVANNPSDKTEHFGSRIVHDGKGYLYFSVGDRGQRKLAQDLLADQGKIHRLKLDGSIPEDNPFYNSEKARKTIWSFGHRNPQGLVYDYKNNILYEQEHGPRGGDEINKIQKGENFGWPKVTFGKEYYGPKISKFTSKKGYADPVYQFTPSIAPSGLELYRGNKILFLENNLISGALALRHLNALDIQNPKDIKEKRFFKDLDERVRDVKQSPDGLLYFLTDSGKIFLVKE